MISLMTPCLPGLEQEGKVILEYQEGYRVILEYENGDLAATYESMAIEDARLKSVWGEKIYRLLLKSKKPVDKGKWILDIRAFK